MQVSKIWVDMQVPTIYIEMLKSMHKIVILQGDSYRLIRNLPTIL